MFEQNKIDRVIKFHKLIDKQATGTPDEFAALLKISRRHLYDIIEEFKIQGAKIKYSRTLHTFFYEEEFTVKINTLTISH